jgi:hypothetical protein
VPMRGLVTLAKSVVTRWFGSQENKSDQGIDWSREPASDVLLSKGLIHILAEHFREVREQKDQKEKGELS